MFGITDLATYLLGTIFIVLLPGPNSMYVLSVAASRGLHAGFLGALAIVVGDAILMTCAAVGAASLLKTHPTLFMFIKYVGGAYLAWMGFKMLKGAYASVRNVTAEVELDASVQDIPQSEDTSNPFVKALFISLMNPKAILFFVSFFVQFVDPNYPKPFVTFLALGIILQLCSIAYLTVLILSGHHLARKLKSKKRLSAFLLALTGCIFMGFGLKLALTSL